MSLSLTQLQHGKQRHQSFAERQRKRKERQRLSERTCLCMWAGIPLTLLCDSMAPRLWNGQHAPPTKLSALLVPLLSDLTGNSHENGQWVAPRGLPHPPAAKNFFHGLWWRGTVRYCDVLLIVSFCCPFTAFHCLSLPFCCPFTAFHCLSAVPSLPFTAVPSRCSPLYLLT